jgi:hypothetical protein
VYHWGDQTPAGGTIVPGRILGLVVLLFLTACGGNGTTTSGDPTGPSSPTVTAVTVSGTLAIANIGQTSQLSATAHFAKGTTQNITSQATWTASDTTVAVVSPTGLVTSMGVGTVTVTATYQNVSGSTKVTVTRPPAYVLSGLITESVPTTSTVLSGARVELIDSASQGRFTTADGTGHYQITQVPWGNYNVHVSMPGYVDATQQVTLTANATLDFRLLPTPTTTWFTRTGTISATDGSCPGETRPCQVFSLPPVHNTGTFEVTVLWNGAETSLGVQLFNADNGQVVASASAPGQPNQYLSTQIRVPGNYQLRVVALTISGSVGITLHVTACPN